MNNIVFYPAWMRIIGNIHKYGSINEMSVDLNITYSHVYKILKHFEERRWIIKEKQGRKIKIILTSIGMEIHNLVSVLLIGADYYGKPDVKSVELGSSKLIQTPSDD